MRFDVFTDVVWPEFQGDPFQYIEQLLEENSKEKIKKHTLEVTQTGRKIAQKFQLNSDGMALCCYCHDIAGVLKPSHMLRYALDNKMILDEAERRYPFLLHGRFSAMMAESILNISNPAILAAVACHSTLRAEASDYDMALFIADKLSWDQEGTPPFYDIVYEALEHSLTHACRVYIEYVFEHGMLLYPHQDILAARKWLAAQ